MAFADPAPFDPSSDDTPRPSDPAMRRAIREQLEAQWQGALPPAAQQRALAVLCDDPTMQAYFERAGCLTAS